MSNVSNSTGSGVITDNDPWNDFLIQNFAVLGLIVAGAIWGATNPFLEAGSKEDKQEAFDLSLKSLLKTILNYKFIVPFGINQLGSLLYYYFLGKASFSIGPLVANSVSFLITYIVEKQLKGRKFTKEAGIALAFITAGLYLSII